MGVSYYNSANVQPKPQDDVPNYIKHVYKMHQHRSYEQAAMNILTYSGRGISDLWRALQNNIFGDMRYCTDTTENKISLDCWSPSTYDCSNSAAAIDYKNITACIVLYNKENKTMVIVTPSFAGDENYIVGFYSRASSDKNKFLTRTTHCEHEFITNHNKVMTPSFLKDVHDYLYFGIPPETVGDSSFGTH